LYHFVDPATDGQQTGKRFVADAKKHADGDKTPADNLL